MPKNFDLARELQSAFENLGDPTRPEYSNFKAYYELVNPNPLPPWQEDVISKLSSEGITLVLAPPGHGKTTLLCTYAAWLIGRNPNIRIMVLTHSVPYSVVLLDYIEQFLRHPGHIEVFGNVLPPRNSSKWKSDARTVNRTLPIKDPTMFAVGILSGMVGFRADVIIGDDIVTLENSLTPTVRKNTWYRFNFSALTRLEPNGRAFIIGNRFHYDDLYGRIMRSGAANVLVYPSSPEKPLWPERFPPEHLERIRERDPEIFQAQYLQDPPNTTNSILNEDWISYFSDMPPVERRTYIFGVDLAASDRASSNKFAIAIGFTIPGTNVVFVTNTIERQLKPREQINFIRSLYARYHPAAVVVETNAFQSIAADDLTMSGLPIVRFNASAPKDIRIRALANSIKEQRVMLRGHITDFGLVPHPDVMPFIKAWRNYPTGDDDILDATYYLAYGGSNKMVSAPISVSTTKEKRRAIAKRLLRRTTYRDNLSTVHNLIFEEGDET